jgi:urease accessory protein
MNTKRFALACLMTLVIAEPALAHSPIKGIGSFFNGLLHPVLVPAHLLLLLAVGVFWGQQGPQKIEVVLGVFAFATILGLTAAWFSIGAEVEALVLVLSATIGLLIAIRPAAGLLWCSVIALLAGFFLGGDSAQDELSGKAKLFTLFGNAVAIYLLPLYAMVLADYFNKKEWQKIGIRILGSWIAASSLLVLALSLSTRPWQG